MLATATYTAEQYVDLDGFDATTIRSLEFEVCGEVDGDKYVEILDAKLVKMSEIDSGETLESRRFRRDDAAAKCYGNWFLQQIEKSDSLREKVEELLIEDRDSTIEESQIRAADRD